MTERRRKVLVMDDSETVLEATQEILEEAGYDVVTLSSPALLPSVLHRERPDLALIDVSMPVMTGGSVIELMRRSTLHRCPLVLFSDQDNQRLEALASSCGATGYIRKTHDRAVLLREIFKYLHPDAPKPTPPRVVTALEKPRVLIYVVDGVALDRNFARDSIQGAGYECVALNDAAQCLAQLKIRRPALILLDLNMTGMKGDACCRAIRENPEWSQIPIVMASSNYTAAEVMLAWHAGADDFLPKPFTNRQLEQKLNAVRNVSAPAPLRTASGTHVLLVEQSPSFRSRLGRMLELSGYRVAYARSSSEAISIATQESTALGAVLLDLSLLGDPLDLIKKLGGLTKAKVVAMSAMKLEPGLHGQLEAVTGQSVADKKLPCELIVNQLNAALRRAQNLSFATRVPFFAPVEFRVHSDPLFSSGFSYDLSATGLFVTTLNPASPGTAIELRLTLPGHGRVACNAKVAWANELHARTTYSYMIGMGLQFVGLESSVAAMLAKFAAVRPGERPA